MSSPTIPAETAAPPLARVLQRMTTLLAGLAPGDGVACFTRLYLAVTSGVDAGLKGVTFADPAFLAQLDERFADLFFAGIDQAARDPRRAPRAWLPLVEARRRAGVAPLQFAVAGMNAHINRDLPVALAAVAAERGVTLTDGSPQHGDFLRVNGVLARVEPTVKEQYVPRPLVPVARLLRRLGHVDDVVAMWDVSRARDAAWVNGRALAALRDEPELAAQFLATLDRAVGLASRALLVPAESRVASLARRLGL